MPIDEYLCHLLAGNGVDGIQASYSSHIDTCRRCVVAHVVGIATDVDGPARHQGLCVHQLQRSRIAIGNGDSAEIADECDALRFVEPGQGAEMNRLGGVEHFDRVVAECRDEQPLRRRIEGEMVNPPLYAGQSHRRDLPERGRCLGLRPLTRDDSKRGYTTDDESPHPGLHRRTPHAR